MSYYSVFEKKFCGWKQQLTYNSRGHSLRRSKSPGAHHAETAILESCFKLCHCMARDGGPFPRSSAVQQLKFPAVFSTVQFSKLAFLYTTTLWFQQRTISNTPKGPLRFSDFIASNSWPFGLFLEKYLSQIILRSVEIRKLNFQKATLEKKIETESFFESKNRMQRSHFFGQGRRL